MSIPVDTRPTVRAEGSATQPRRLRPDVELIVAAALFVSFAALAARFPFTGDDWAWGSQIGLDRLDTLFRDYNGRYAGNLAVLALTRSEWLLPLVMAGSVVLIVFLVLHLSDNRSLPGYLTVYALFLSMPKDVWRQGIAWTSGFSNYALATVWLLVFLVSVKAALQRRESRVRPLECGAILAFGFVGQLFIEHVTLYIVVAAIAALVYGRVRSGRLLAPLVCWVVAAVAGAAVMFSNGAYRLAATSPDRYQQIGGTPPSGSRLSEMANVLTKLISQYGITGNRVLNIVTVLLVALLALAASRRSRNTSARVALGAAGVLLAGVAALLVLGAFGVVASPRRLSPFLGLLGYFAVVGLAVPLVRDPRAQRLVVVAAVSIPVLVGPLLVVKPLGPRCFLPTYALLLVIVSVLLKRCLDEYGPVLGVATTVAALLVAALTLSQHLVRYGEIDQAETARLQLIRSEVAAGAERVVVRPLPHGDWVHQPDPTPSAWEARYKLFNGVPADVQIVVR